MSPEPFVFDQYGRLEIHKRHMDLNRPYLLKLGSDWYIVHRAEDGVRMARWEPAGELANGLFPNAPRISPSIGVMSGGVGNTYRDYPLNFGQQVAARSNLPRDLDERADAIEKGDA